MNVPSNVDVLATEITALKDLHSQLQQLRRLPHGLIRNGKVPLDVVGKAREALLGETAQKALAHAAKDHSEVPIVRINSKKRQKSPEPYIREKKAKPSVFPDFPPCTDLRALLVDWNKENPSCRAAIYRARHGDTSDNVLIVRVVDVMTAYLMLGKGRDGGFVVEAISVFGPREAKAGPFSTSGYSVFATVSERVGGMLSATAAGVAGVLSCLGSYRGLFLDGCCVCGRVLSENEAHLPVDRIWGSSASGESWKGKHLTCR